MLLSHLLAPTMLLEELSELDAMPHEQLLNTIKQRARTAVNTAELDRLEMRLGKVKPRHQIAFPWRVETISLWRIKRLWHPLWLGEDGAIYRAYDWKGDSDPQSFHFGVTPIYWMRAEIEKRDTAGLQRILDALNALIPPQEPTAKSL